MHFFLPERFSLYTSVEAFLLAALNSHRPETLKETCFRFLVCIRQFRRNNDSVRWWFTRLLSFMSEPKLEEAWCCFFIVSAKAQIHLNWTTSLCLFWFNSYFSLVTTLFLCSAYDSAQNVWFWLPQKQLEMSSRLLKRNMKFWNKNATKMVGDDPNSCEKCPALVAIKTALNLHKQSDCGRLSGCNNSTTIRSTSWWESQLLSI